MIKKASCKKEKVLIRCLESFPFRSYMHNKLQSQAISREEESHKFRIWHRGYKTFSMLNTAEHEILNAQKYKNIMKLGFFLGSDKPRMLFFPLINVKIRAPDKQRICANTQLNN